MKSKINIKVLFFILAIIFLILSILIIRGTYARYVTSLTADGSVELGRWLIKVNDQHIFENSDFSEKIIPEFTDSEYIAEGKIVPTSTGSVQIKFDYEEVTVPFTYELSFSTAESTFLQDFMLTSYSFDNGEITTIDDPTAPITETILPLNTNRTRTLQLNFAWIDGTGEVSNDIQDTAFAHNIDELGMRFNLTFTQLQPTS